MKYVCQDLAEVDKLFGICAASAGRGRPHRARGYIVGSDTHMWHAIIEPFGQETQKINGHKNVAIICKPEAKKQTVWEKMNGLLSANYFFQQNNTLTT